MTSEKEFEHDVIVIGSGAGGGMAAWALTRAGVKVLMLEAGRDYDPYTETPMFNSIHEAPLRGSSSPDKDFGFFDATVDGGWQVPDEPYTVGEGSEFKWWRSRMLGGRTNHFGRHVPRFGPYDFKPYSRDGLGVDWPVSYEEMAPWYDLTEKLVGVCGTNSGLENHPDSGPDVLQPPPAFRSSEILLKGATQKLGIPCEPARRAILTRPIEQVSRIYINRNTFLTKCDHWLLGRTTALLRGLRRLAIWAMCPSTAIIRGRHRRQRPIWQRR
jgi:choline dehydrogenase-like flavoprotein